MRDSEVVASIVAGDPDGLAEAYDRYADPLYKYCRSLLGDPADAADAVQDTFVIAASRLDGLRDAERLRAWLYAVARNECLRIARARKTTTALDEAPEVTGEGGHVGDEAEQADLVTLVEDATMGLNPAEREAIELQLRQGLEPAEIATMLGVSRNHVHALLSRARDQLLACLGVLLVSRAGRGDCRELAGLLSGWDGRLSVPMRKRVHRHIERCAVCTARRAFELRPAMLLGLSPEAAILAGAAESLRGAAGPPAALRAHTLTLAVDRTPSAMAHRAAVLNRAGAFGRHGFPKPAHVPMAPLPRGAGSAAWRSSARGRTAVIAGGVVLGAAVAAAVAAFVLAGHAGHGALSGGKPPVKASAVLAPPSSASPTATRQATPSGTPTATASGARSPAPTSTAASSGPATSPAATTSPTTSARPTPSSSTPRPSPAPTSSSPTPTPTPGTLAVSPPGGQLGLSQGGATISLTAHGGTVHWSITVSSGRGHVGVQPSAGTLQQGGSVSVTVQANSPADGRHVTVNPGAAEFTLVTGDSGNSQVERAWPTSPPGSAAPVTLPTGRIVFLFI